MVGSVRCPYPRHGIVSIHRAAERNCPKTSIGSNLEPQKSTKEGEEALFRCSGGPNMEAPEAALDPFRTVSLGSSVNSGDLQPGTLGEEHYCPRLGFAQVADGYVYVVTIRMRSSAVHNPA